MSTRMNVPCSCYEATFMFCECVLLTRCARHLQWKLFFLDRRPADWPSGDNFQSTIWLSSPLTEKYKRLPTWRPACRSLHSRAKLWVRIVLKTKEPGWDWCIWECFCTLLTYVLVKMIVNQSVTDYSVWPKKKTKKKREEKIRFNFFFQIVIIFFNVTEIDETVR